MAQVQKSLAAWMHGCRYLFDLVWWFHIKKQRLGWNMLKPRANLCGCEDSVQPPQLRPFRYRRCRKRSQRWEIGRFRPPCPSSAAQTLAAVEILDSGHGCPMAFNACNCCTPARCPWRFATACVAAAMFQRAREVCWHLGVKAIFVMFYLVYSRLECRFYCEICDYVDVDAIGFVRVIRHCLCWKALILNLHEPTWANGFTFFAHKNGKMFWHTSSWSRGSGYSNSMLRWGWCQSFPEQFWPSKVLLLFRVVLKDHALGHKTLTPRIPYTYLPRLHQWVRPHRFHGTVIDA